MNVQFELGALRYTIQRFVLLVIFAGLLFCFAGRWNWLRGWEYVVTVGLAEAATLAVLAWRAPATLSERGKLHAETTRFDRLFASMWLALSFATPIVAGLEVRSGAPLMSWSVFWVGVPILLAATAFGAWAMLENEHFEQFVRIQDDRAHRVVDSGPYRIVRHPGYLAAIVGAFVTPLVLGTTSAFVPAVMVAALFVWRTAREDETLRRDLPGYTDYSKRTRARLFPALW